MLLETVGQRPDVAADPVGQAGMMARDEIGQQLVERLAVAIPRELRSGGRVVAAGRLAPQVGLNPTMSIPIPR
jgi:hypothetical protein